MAKQKEIIPISSLDAFAPAEVNVRLEFEDHVQVVPMRQLGHAEYQRLGWQVPNPTPPITGADPITKRPTFDFNDGTYQQRMQEAETQRAYKRLLASLRLDVPGDDEAAQIAYLQGLDANVIRMLFQAVSLLVSQGAANIEAKAATFHAGRTENGKAV